MQHPNYTQLIQAANNVRAQFRYKRLDGSYSPPVGIMTVLLDETKQWELVTPEELLVEDLECVWLHPFILRCIVGVVILLAICGYLAYPQGGLIG